MRSQLRLDGGRAIKISLFRARRWSGGVVLSAARRMTSNTNPVTGAVREWLTEALCCTRRVKSSEKREYDQLRVALARKQEEVRRLQEQCAALDSRAQLQAEPQEIPSETERAATLIQSKHRGNLSRGHTADGS